MLGTVRQEKKTVKTIEACLMSAAVYLSKYIHMEAYRRREAGPEIKGRGMNLSPGSLSGVCPCKDRGSIIGYHPLCAFCSALNPGNRHFGGAAILSGDAKGRRTVESKAG